MKPLYLERTSTSKIYQGLYKRLTSLFYRRLRNYIISAWRKAPKNATEIVVIFSSPKACICLSAHKRCIHSFIYSFISEKLLIRPCSRYQDHKNKQDNFIGQFHKVIIAGKESTREKRRGSYFRLGAQGRCL